MSTDTKNTHTPYAGRVAGLTSYARTAREAQAGIREAMQLALENMPEDPHYLIGWADAAGGDHYEYRRVGSGITRRRLPGNIAC